MNQPRDKGLNGNEKIEQAVAALQQEPTQEQLAHTLTVIRRRIKEHGQLVVAVEPNLGSEQMQLRAIRTADGASWWYAFTSFEEELKGAEPVQSTFLVDMINAGVWSPYSLYREDIATFAAGGDYKQSDATGFISIYGLPTKVQAIVNNEKEGK